jgi:hypothetical protein
VRALLSTVTWNYVVNSLEICHDRYRLSNRLSIISKLKILEVQGNLLEALLLTIDHVISTGLCKLRRSTNLKQISATRTSRIPMFDHDRLGIVPVFLNAPRMRLVHTVLLLLPLMKSTTDEKESMTLLSESAKKNHVEYSVAFLLTICLLQSHATY